MAFTLRKRTSVGKALFIKPDVGAVSDIHEVVESTPLAPLVTTMKDRLLAVLREKAPDIIRITQGIVTHRLADLV